MRNTIIFNNRTLLDFNVYISGSGVFNAPERDTEEVEIPGKNGTLVVDKGRYKNIDVTYPAFITHNFSENIEALRNYLLSQRGFCRIEDTYHPDEFRLGKFKGAFTAKPVENLIAGEFNLKFNCYPQRFLKSGELPITITGTKKIMSTCAEDAKPLIRAYGTGSFSINGVAVQITTANGYTDLDCDLQEAYKDTLATDCNSNIVLTNGVFPVLSFGENTISLSGITKLELTPRWWIV